MDFVPEDLQRPENCPQIYVWTQNDKEFQKRFLASRSLQLEFGSHQTITHATSVEESIQMNNVKMVVCKKGKANTILIIWPLHDDSIMYFNFMSHTNTITYFKTC